MNFGAALKSARERAGLLQADFAKKADLDPSYVSMLENNRKSPTLTVYFRICGVLGMTGTELMRQIEAEKSPQPTGKTRKRR